MFESIILGITQGIAEWLPVSSEGLIFLIKTNFFYSGERVRDIASLALFLHFGTFLAALVYFRKDVLELLKALFNYKKAKAEDLKVLIFLIVTTLISGVLGLILLNWVDTLDLERVEDTTKIITMVIGFLLLVTAILQFKARRNGQRESKDIKHCDSFILGIVQAFASLPGLSRSGLTVSTLLFRKFQEETALKLSFLMSLPLVLGGNIVLNLDKFSLNLESLLGLLFSFIFGLLTIDILLRVAKKINFAWFVLVFGLLMIVAGVI